MLDLSVPLSKFDIAVRRITELTAGSGGASVRNIEESVPYQTGNTVDGSTEMEIMLDGGSLPNMSSKVIQFPSAVTQNAIPGSAFINLNATYMIQTTSTGVDIRPLPFSAKNQWNQQIELKVTSSGIFIRTAENFASATFIVTLTYLV